MSTETPAPSAEDVVIAKAMLSDCGYREALASATSYIAMARRERAAQIAALNFHEHEVASAIRALKETP